MNDFQFQNTTKVYFGKDQLGHLHEEVLKYGKSVLVVYGGGSIKKIGLYDKVMKELKENNIKLINLYQTDSIYNKLVEDEELTYNTIDNADELNGKFIFKDEYSKLLLFEIKYIFFDIIRNLSDYNKMIELKKDSENDED